uniref:Uncharacterized protein n=1 Tax=Ciona savignyi TaxID=51511 RepID=H2ZJ66_CIOSA
MNSIAGAIQHDFLRAIPTAPKSPSQKSPGSAFDILNAKTGSQFRESSSMLKIPDKLKVRRASVSCVTNHDDSKKYDFLGSSKDDTLLLIQKTDGDRPPLPKTVPKQHAVLSTTDLPRNALVNYLGSIEITSDELRVLDLERSLLALKGCIGQFALLRVLGDGFSLQDCNEVNPSEPTAERKNRKKRYKKIGQSEAEDSGRAEDRKAQSKGVANILSCMKCVGPSRYQLLQHNNSINLKGYDVMKRKKKMIFFEYRKIIYSGVDIKGAPSNLLIWLYHIVSGSCTSVQCYAAECDDAQHARNLSRALGQQMATLR